MNEQLGPELSAAARQLIAEARGADEPSAEDEARVKARWLAGIAAGAGVSSLSEAVRAAASTGWGLKVGALVAAFVAAGAGVLLGWPQTSGHPAGHEVNTAPAVRTGGQPAEVAPLPAQPVHAEPVAALPQPVVAQPVVPQPAVPQPVAEQPSAPELAKPAAEAATPAEAPVQQPELAVVPPRAAEAKEVRSASPRAAASTRHAEKLQEKAVAAALEEPPTPSTLALSGQLGEEIAALSEIRNNLQAGAATRALEQLSEYRRRFGQPSLAMEADALRVDALCRAGQREAAREAATAFVSNWPNSPLQQRVSAACP